MKRLISAGLTAIGLISTVVSSVVKVEPGQDFLRFGICIIALAILIHLSENKEVRS